jgi:protein required for attachment to host cells
MHATRTYVLIADAGQARAYLSMKPGDQLQRVAGFELSEDIPRVAALKDHKPGTSQPSVGSAHHTVGTSDPRREVKRRFAEEVAAALEAEHRKGAFDKLVIAAPPAMLGDLRVALPKAVAATVVAELHKDLVKTPEHELLQHFGDVQALSK